MPAQRYQAADSQGMHQHGNGSSYGPFFAMIGTSTVVMYGLMYLNTDALDYVFFSQMRHPALCGLNPERQETLHA